MKNNYGLFTIKVGTHVITNPNGLPDEDIISSISTQISNVRKSGHRVILITSGAVAAGRSLFPENNIKDTVEQRQVLSSLGQVELMSKYKSAFEKSGEKCSQVLVTREDFKSRSHYLNMKNCLSALLKNDIVPVINENDVVSITELMFTDNDELAGLVSAMMNTDLLILLSDVDGIYTGDPSDPNSSLIPVFKSDKIGMDVFTAGRKSEFGRGGILTKCHIADKIAGMGIPVRIANGHKENVITRIVENESAPGTLFPARKTASSIKKYIAHAYDTKGKVIINEGARVALSSDTARSLLPIGVTNVSGKFKKGDLIRISDIHGKEIGLGLAKLNSRRSKMLIGKKNSKPLIHYDHLYMY